MINVLSRFLSISTEQLALIRDLGRPFRPGEIPPEVVISVVADQLDIDPAVFALYAQREETWREHARGECPHLLMLVGGLLILIAVLAGRAKH